MTQIALLDDHKLFRESIKMFLRTLGTYNICLDIDNADAFFRELPKQAVHLVLLDLQMPEKNGFAVCQEIRMKYPKIKILVLTHLTDSISLQRAIRAGADGYLTKYSSLELLDKAIYSVMHDSFYLDESLTSVFKNLREPEKNAQKDFFSEREIEIIEMACREYNSAKIAEKLFINVKTVDTHRKRIMEKTGSRNFLGAILFALKNNYVNIE